MNMAQDKKPFKLIEIPLGKFKEDAIPFHRINYEKRRNNVQKLLNNEDKTLLRKEARDISAIISQLKELASELITLKTEVQDDDLARFRLKADRIYEDISDLICKYDGLQQLCMSRCTDMNDEFQDKGLSEEDSYVNLQIQENVEDLKLQEQFNRLKRVENLQEDIQNVHEMFADFHQMVDEQSIAVNSIENNVEEAHEDVKLGFREILKASKIKKASYPILGASFGAIAGGPVGAAVGIKAGLLVAATCAVFGYFTGRYMRTHNDSFIESTAAVVENTIKTDSSIVSEVVSRETVDEDKKHK